jgi:uncharacterized protein YbjT (DUF2867 family)
MIVVAGARGNIGSEVVRQLVRHGAAVRALSRDPSKLQAAGHEVAKADLLDPASLDAAFAGAERLFLMADAIDLPRAAAHASAAATRAGVRHVVMVSSGTIAIQPEVTIGRWHREAEEVIQASGLAWTFLRPGNFASNALRWAGMIRAQGAVFAPAGGQTAPIDPRDIADVAVKALTGGGHEGKTYSLTGPTLMTAAEQVAAIGAALEKELRFVSVPMEGARAGMLKSGMSDVMADAILQLISAGTDGRDAAVTSTIRDVAEHEARSFADWVRDHVHAFR